MALPDTEESLDMMKTEILRPFLLLVCRGVILMIILC